MFDDTIHLPATISHPKVKKAADEYRQLQADLAAEHRQLDAAEQNRQQAEEADRKALGAAIRSGKPDPGTEGIAAANAAIAVSQRRMEALEIAVADSRRALIQTVERHREEWQHQLDGRAAEAAAAFAAAVELVAATHEELAEAVMVSGWLRGFPTARVKPSARTSNVASLVQRNGAPESWGQVVDALRDHAAAAVPQVVEATT